MTAWAGNAVVITENFAEYGTLSGGGYNSSYPITNLQNRFQRIVARTTDATNANTKIVADLGAAQPIGGVIVCNGNWSLDSQYRVQSSDASDFASIKYDSGWKQFPGFVVDQSLLDADDPDYSDGVLRNNLLGEFPLNLIEIIPDADVEWTRYWRVLFDDTSNADGFLQYGYLMIGRALRVSVNYDESNAFGFVESSETEEAMGGEEASSEYSIKRTWQGNFGFLSYRELFGKVVRMAVKSRSTRPVFFVPNPSDTLYLQERSFLGKFQKMPDVKQSLVQDIGAVAMSFQELK